MARGKVEASYRLGVFATAIYHCILAWLYGGYPIKHYPDEYWNIITGMYLVGEAPAPVVPDKMILLHVYIGALYKTLGFPWFLYGLCSWCILSLLLLMLGAYLVGKHYLKNEKIGYFSALLVGWNWQLSWYGHRVLNDVILGAFMIFTFGLVAMYWEKREMKIAALIGISLAFCLWAKESALYLIPPLIIWILLTVLTNGLEAKHLTIFSISFLLTFSLFATICLVRYGHPLYPLVRRIEWYGIFEKQYIPLYFNINIAGWLPFALGAVLLPFLFALLGFIYLYKNRLLFLPTWAIYCYLFHIFLVPTLPHSDQHMVHYTPLFLITAAYGLSEFLEKFSHKRSLPRKILPFLALLMIASTNLYIPSSSLLGKTKMEIVPLHVKIANNKLERIQELISTTSNSDWLYNMKPAQCFYRPTPIAQNLFSESFSLQGLDDNAAIPRGVGKNSTKTTSISIFHQDISTPCITIRRGSE